MRARSLGFPLGIVLWLATATAGAAESPAVPVFERAGAAVEAGDRAALEKARDDIDAVLVVHPDSPMSHYTRGWILSHLDRPADAVTEYEETLRLDPKFTEAAYNAGVVLMALSREAEAINQFEKATALDPKLIDAHYNLGQAYYNRHEFAKALTAWSRARELDPKDFQTAKKIVQAYHGMGDREGAARAREQAIETWKQSADPAVRKLTEFVFDQFETSGWKVMGSEVFERPEDKGYLYVFRVAGPDGNVVGTVRLEPGYDFDKRGVAYIIGMSKGSRMWTPGPAFESLPAYDTLKPIVISAIAREFPANP